MTYLENLPAVMFQDYFGISEDPFSITPDPKYLYLSERHRNGFAHLLYGVTEGGGFMQLTGEVGTGKTLLCRKLLAELPKAVDVAFIFNPRLSPLELVATICDELRVLYPLGCNSIKEVVDFLNAYLLESHSQGRRTVVIIDEAQNLSYESLEQIRLLTNLETPSQKLLQIILVGQPELRSLLQREELRQLAQRVTARYHLTPLSRSETRAYIQHRLHVAGFQHPLFTTGAVKLVYRLSRGIPRVINILCNRGMLMAFAKKTNRITKGMIKQVANELSGNGESEASKRSWVWATLGILICTLAALVVWNSNLLPGVTAMLASDEMPSEPTTQQVKIPESQPKPEIVTQPLPDMTAKVSESDEQSVVEGERSARIDSDHQTSSSELATVAIISKEQTPVSDSTSNTKRAEKEPQGLASLVGNENSTFVTLFGYWQSVYPMEDESRSSCDRAESVGLSCIYGRGSWDNLEYYNRPAVLELIMDDGQRYNVVASALTDNGVTLDLNGRRFSFSRDEIDKLWTGSYIILWRPPGISSDSLSLGYVGRDVGWLISMLDRIEGVKTVYDPLKAQFDLQIQRRVMRFQRAHNLSADGVVGKQTLIQLNSAVVDSTRPVLRQVGG
ncbi:MAG: AAA family ATPase [Candidatus Thiodiazotropha sp. (ex Lucinoma borealis)]|nr:AAA family ATPase [Candidatus Thiodiazotropha sp. (ex Lucinoma borealis)]